MVIIKVALLPHLRRPRQRRYKEKEIQGLAVEYCFGKPPACTRSAGLTTSSDVQLSGYTTAMEAAAAFNGERELGWARAKTQQRARVTAGEPSGSAPA